MVPVEDNSIGRDLHRSPTLLASLLQQALLVKPSPRQIVTSGPEKTRVDSLLRLAGGNLNGVVPGWRCCHRWPCPYFAGRSFRNRRAITTPTQTNPTNPYPTASGMKV